MDGEIFYLTVSFANHLVLIFPQNKTFAVINWPYVRISEVILLSRMHSSYNRESLHVEPLLFLCIERSSLLGNRYGIRMSQERICMKILQSQLSQLPWSHSGIQLGSVMRVASDRKRCLVLEDCIPTTLRTLPGIVDRKDRLSVRWWIGKVVLEEIPLWY